MKRRVRVTLYGRSGCHLCEEAEGEILKAGHSDSYTLEKVDIDTDPALRTRYGMDIPVVLIDGVMTFKHRLDAREFERQLARALRDEDAQTAAPCSDSRPT
ncbi:MAG TPA: glutaredoxin family protein [Pyrinomonadaceae bacterium]|nr:glutaredoxin family protein [Pyrinomonadaceae bacterium]